MANRAKDVHLYERAAEQRLIAAEFLLGNGFHLDAVYLAGYAVECSLKALILKRTPRNVYASMLLQITRGKRAHDFEFLATTLKREPLNCVFPEEITQNLNETASWSTDLRYQVGLVKYNEADRFISVAKSIKEWAERS